MPSLVFRSVALDLVRLQEVIEETSRRHEQQENAAFLLSNVPSSSSTNHPLSSSLSSSSGGIPSSSSSAVPYYPSSTVGNDKGLSIITAQPYSAPRLKSIFSPERGMNMDIRMTILQDMDQAASTTTVVSSSQQENFVTTNSSSVSSYRTSNSSTVNGTTPMDNISITATNRTTTSTTALFPSSDLSSSSSTSSNLSSSFLSNSYYSNRPYGNNSVTYSNDLDTSLTSIMGLPDKYMNESTIRTNRIHRFAETLQGGGGRGGGGPTTTTCVLPSSSVTSQQSNEKIIIQPNPTGKTISTNNFSSASVPSLIVPTANNGKSSLLKSTNTLTKIPSFNSIKDEPIDAPAPVEPPSPLAIKPGNGGGGSYSSSSNNGSNYHSRVNSNLDLAGTVNAASSSSSSSVTKGSSSVPTNTTAMNGGGFLQPHIGLSLDEEENESGDNTSLGTMNDKKNKNINTTTTNISSNNNLSTLVNYSSATIHNNNNTTTGPLSSSTSLSFTSPSSPPPVPGTSITDDTMTTTTHYYYSNNNPILPMSPLVPNTVRRTNVPLATGDKRGLRSGALFSPIAPYPETLRKDYPSNLKNNSNNNNNGRNTEGYNPAINGNSSPVTGIPLAVPLSSSPVQDTNKDNNTDPNNNGNNDNTTKNTQSLDNSLPPSSLTIPNIVSSSSSSSSILASTLPSTSQALHRAVAALAEAYATERMRAEALSASQGATADQVVALAETLAAVQAVANRLEETTRILLPNNNGLGSPVIQGQLQSPVSTNNLNSSSLSNRSPIKVNNFTPTVLPSLSSPKNSSSNSTTLTTNTGNNDETSVKSLSPRQEPYSTLSAAAVPVPSLSVRLSSPPLITPHTLPYLTGTGNPVTMIPPPVSVSLPLTNTVVPKRNSINDLTLSAVNNNGNTKAVPTNGSGLPLTDTSFITPTPSITTTNQNSLSFQSSIQPSSQQHHPWVAGMLSPRRLPPTQGINNTVTNNLRVQIPSSTDSTNNNNNNSSSNSTSVSGNTTTTTEGLYRSESVPLLSPPVPRRENNPESKLVASTITVPTVTTNGDGKIINTKDDNIKEEEGMMSPISPPPPSPPPPSSSSSLPKPLPLAKVNTSTTDTKVSSPARPVTVPVVPTPVTSTLSPVTPPVTVVEPVLSSTEPILSVAENAAKTAYTIRQDNDPFFAPRRNSVNMDTLAVSSVTTPVVGTVPDSTKVTSNTTTTEEKVAPWVETLFDECKDTMSNPPVLPTTITVSNSSKNTTVTPSVVNTKTKSELVPVVPTVEKETVNLSTGKNTELSVSSPAETTPTVNEEKILPPVNSKDTGSSTTTMKQQKDENNNYEVVINAVPKVNQGDNHTVSDNEDQEEEMDNGNDENRTVDSLTVNEPTKSSSSTTVSSVPVPTVKPTGKKPSTKDETLSTKEKEAIVRQEKKEQKEQEQITQELKKQQSSVSSQPPAEVPGSGTGTTSTTTTSTTTTTKPTKASPTGVNDPTLVQLVLDLLNGHIFVKHGRSGWPHARLVWLDATGAELGLRWGKPQDGVIVDPALYKTDAWLSLGDISAVEKGRSATRVLLKSGKASKDNLYWSIIGSNRSLDLEAQSPEERNLWADGFAKLLRETNTLQEIMMWLFNNGHWAPPGVAGSDEKDD